MPNTEQTLTNHKTPFEGMVINDDEFLDKLEGRYPCPRCSKSRKYFCYSCYIPISELEGKLPVVKLPFKIDIIKHKNEIDGKSTAAHAAVLASEDVSVYTYPNIPDYERSSVVLIYPSFEALTVHQLFDEHSERGIYNMLPKGHNKTTLMTAKSRNDNGNNCINLNCNTPNILPIKKAVFIDSTWNQSKGIYKDTRINSLRCVVLQQRISQFWRHHKGSPRWYLSTIEAIHQFLIEIHLNMWGLNAGYNGLLNCFSDKKFDHLVLNSKDSYNGQYDNLLFFLSICINLYIPIMIMKCYMLIKDVCDRNS